MAKRKPPRFPLPQFEESASMLRNPFWRRDHGSRFRSIAFLVFGLVFLGVAACGSGPPRVVVFNPLQGSFTTAATIQVDGVLIDVNLDAVADVQVNGISAMPLAPGGLFLSLIHI